MSGSSSPVDARAAILDMRLAEPDNRAAPQAIFAVEFDGLPDFWDNSLGLEAQQQQIAAVLRRQHEFVRSLAFVDTETTFELRIVNLPAARRRLRIYVVVSVEEWLYAEPVWQLFHSIFPSDIDYRIQSVPPAEIQHLRYPFGTHPLDYYEWVPVSRELVIGHEPPIHFIQPPQARPDGRLSVLRLLAQQSTPLVLGYAVSPCGPDETFASQTRQRWEDVLRLIEPVLAIGQVPGGTYELEQRLGPPLIAQLRNALLHDSADNLPFELLRQHLERQMLQSYVRVPSFLLEHVRAVAIRMIRSNTFFRWRIHAAVPQDSQLSAQLRMAVADDIGQAEDRLVTPYQLHQLSDNPLLEPAINFGYIRTRWCRPLRLDANGQYEPQGEIIDDEGAAGLLQIPILPEGGIPGIHSYVANPFSAWQLDDVDQPQHPGITLGSYIDSRIGLLHQQGPAAMLMLDDLTRHTLITGSTGGGKSTTSKRLLTAIHQRGVPFLAIEPIKDEYADLAFMPEFLAADPLRYPLVLRPGSPGSPLWFNPFYIRQGGYLNTHISYLQSCFMAAFPMPGVFGMVLRRILHAAYQHKAQQLVASGRFTASPYREDDVVRERLRDDDFPDLDLLEQVAKAEIDKLAYRGEFASNLRAAIELRLNSLRIGMVGSMLNRRATDTSSFECQLERLLRLPVVIQLSQVADKSEKALLIAFLLTALYEYYELQPSSDHLRHVTLIEEAHVLLENVPRTQSEDTANTRGKAIEIFADMLAEIRSRGEGLVIVEQLPSKLLPEAIKNTNLKIMHRLTARDDREILGAAMNLDERQTRFATTLRRSQAIVFREGLSEPALIRVQAVTTDREQRMRVTAVLSSMKYERGRIVWPLTLREAFTRCRDEGVNTGTIAHLQDAAVEYLHRRDPALDARHVFAVCWFLHQLAQPYPAHARIAESVSAALLGGWAKKL